MFTNEQPLLFAAIGLRVAAVIAAVLPSTETENQIMGESSDAIKKAVGKLLRTAMEWLKPPRLAQGILKLLFRHFRATFDTGGFGTLV